MCYLVWYLSQSRNGHNNWGNAVYAFARDLVMSTEVEICCPTVTIKTKTKQLLRVCVYLCGDKGSLLTSILRKIWLIVRAEVRNGMVLLLWGCVSSFLLPVPTLNLKGYRVAVWRLECHSIQTSPHQKCAGDWGSHFSNQWGRLWYQQSSIHHPSSV